MSLTGCSFKDRSKFIVPLPSEATVLINNLEPRFGDTLSASASGSVDPQAMGDVRYRFDWFLNDSSNTVFSETLAESETSTLPNALAKDQTWTLVVVPVSTDDRLGASTEVDIVVQNTPPTIQSAGLDDYAPIADEVVHASSFGLADVDVADTVSVNYTWKLSDGREVNTQTLDKSILVPRSEAHWLTPKLPDSR